MTLAALMVLAVSASAEEFLVPLSGKTFTHERIGTLTSIRCAADKDSEDCRLIEQLDLQPPVDWEALAAKAARSKGSVARAIVADQHGGPWHVAVKGERTGLKPDFPGYRVKVEGGKVLEVEMLRRREHWDAAAAELGVDPVTGRAARKKRKLFGD